MALRGLRVMQLPCDGYDGVNVVADVRRGADGSAAYAVDGQSCSNGVDPTRPIATISAESWGPVQAVLQRIATR